MDYGKIGVQAEKSTVEEPDQWRNRMSKRGRLNQEFYKYAEKNRRWSHKNTSSFLRTCFKYESNQTDQSTSLLLDEQKE